MYISNITLNQYQKTKKYKPKSLTTITPDGVIRLLNKHITNLDKISSQFNKNINILEDKQPMIVINKPAENTTFIESEFINL